MIEVLYDNQAFNFQKFGGISRYFAELIKGLNNKEDIRTLPAKYFSENKHIRSKHLTYFDLFTDSFNFIGKTRITEYIKKRELSSIHQKIRSGDFDVFHPTYYDPGFLTYLTSEKPFVLTVHDMIHELYYDYHDKVVSDISKNKKILIAKANQVIAVSQKTKDNILSFFPDIAESTIHVVYHASSLKVSDGELRQDLPSRYILYVGHRWTYKNFEWFINNSAEFLVKEKLTLLCAGGGYFTELEGLLFEKLHVAANVRYFHINNDDDLVALYKNALCFVFPSLYEGFGIPVLEAFSCRCPVILANASCFPEIAGDAALYFDKNNPESLVEQLSRIISDKDLADNLREAGFERNKLYSWHKMVQQHLEIYKSVTSK